MALTAKTFCVNGICILILIMVCFSYTKNLWNKYRRSLWLCLFGEKNFGLLLMKVAKLPRKSLLFLLLLVCGDIESCPGL